MDSNKDKAGDQVIKVIFINNFGSTLYTSVSLEKTNARYGVIAYTGHFTFIKYSLNKLNLFMNYAARNSYYDYSINFTKRLDFDPWALFGKILKNVNVKISLERKNAPAFFGVIPFNKTLFTEGHANNVTGDLAYCHGYNNIKIVEIGKTTASHVEIFIWATANGINCRTGPAILANNHIAGIETYRGFYSYNSGSEHISFEQWVKKVGRNIKDSMCNEIHMALVT